MAARTGPAFEKAMTLAEVLSLPSAVDLDTANRALAIGRSTGYRLAKAGEYPCPVIRFASHYRVATADICRLLGVTPLVGADGKPDEEPFERLRAA